MIRSSWSCNFVIYDFITMNVLLINHFYWSIVPCIQIIDVFLCFFYDHIGKQQYCDQGWELAISAFRMSATVHTRFREITGAMAATAMYSTR